jgi:hypothetical protein
MGVGSVILNPQMQIVDAQGNPVPLGVPIPEDLAQIFSEFLKDGANESLKVDGSSTPVEFEVLADVTDDLKLNEIQFVIVNNKVTIDGNQFINQNILPNGLKIEIRSNDATVELGTLTQSEDFLSIASSGGILLDRSANVDLLVITIALGGAVTLVNGSGDFVRVTVQDNLSSNDWKYFKVTLKATKVTP